MLLIILLAASAGCMLFLALFGWKRRRAVPAARAFSALMLTVALYCGGYAVEIFHDTIPGMLIGSRIEYLGISFLPVFWLLLALHFCGAFSRLSRLFVAALFIIPVGTVLIIFSDGLFHLHYRTVAIASTGPFPMLFFTRGPWYWVHIVFTNVAILTGNALFLSMVFRSARHFRLQASIMFLGSLLPWTALVVHLTGVISWKIDPIPFALATSAPLYAYGLFRFRLFDLTPMARSTLVENLQDGVLVFNHEWRLLDMNRAAVPLLSLPRYEAIGEFRDRILSDFPGILAAIMEDGGVVDENGLAPGSPRLTAQVGVTVIEAGWRKDAGFLVLIHDIAGLKKAESALRESEEKFRLMFESAPDPILLMDDSLRVIDCNSAAIQIFGVTSRGALLHRSLAAFSPEYQSDGTLSSEKGERVADTAYGEGTTSLEWVFHDREGRHIITDMSIVIVSIKGKRVQLVTLRDITEKKKVEQQLRDLSLIDPLTGLNNRRGFLTLAPQQIKIADRLARGVVLIYADLDDLKVINDSCGHKVGDQALRDAAAVLKGALRASDILARIGGDEFVGLVLESEGETERAIKSRIQENLNAFNLQGTRPYSLSFSYGTARHEITEPCCIEELLEQGDRDMYRNKQRRKKSERTG